MAVLDLAPGDGLWFEHVRPQRAGGATFVFFNALTGDGAGWEEAIAAPLRGLGHGSLAFNFRGQRDSPVADPATIGAARIVNDARALLAAEQPARPLYVGLSIGGLFALQAHLGGAPAHGLLLINTLRRPGPRLDWLNGALYRCALTGGSRLIQDLYLPLLTGPAWQAEAGAGLSDDPAYESLPPDHPTARLLACGGKADWAVPWERVEVPTLVMTGLQDRVFNVARDVDDLCRRLPDAQRLDIPDAGHLIPTERPGVVLDACLALARRAR